MKHVAILFFAALAGACVSATQQAVIDRVETAARDRPAPPTEAQLAAAPVLQADQAQFTARPGIREYMAVYPSQALQQGVSGVVSTECLVQADQRVACVVREETPQGFGFAEAALALSASLRVAPTASTGQPTSGQRLLWDVNFNSTGRGIDGQNVPLAGAELQN